MQFRQALYGIWWRETRKGRLIDPGFPDGTLAFHLEGSHNCGNTRMNDMLELKVRKIGNSLGVVLPKEAVSRLHASEGDRLFLIEGPDGAYQLTPYDPAFLEKMRKAEDIISRYRNTLHALAK